jgi:hypothetical protein
MGRLEGKNCVVTGAAGYALDLPLIFPQPYTHEACVSHVLHVSESFGVFYPVPSRYCLFMSNSF